MIIVTINNQTIKMKKLPFAFLAFCCGATLIHLLKITSIPECQLDDDSKRGGLSPIQNGEVYNG